MAFYNVSVLNATESVTGLFSASNDISGGWLISLILIIVFLVSLIILILNFDFVTGLRISSIVTFLVSIGFWGASLLNPKFVLIPAIIVMLTFVFGSITRSLGEE